MTKVYNRGKSSGFLRNYGKVKYQEYVTCGGKMEGDETFYAVSRQSRVINAVATQSYTVFFHSGF